MNAYLSNAYIPTYSLLNPVKHLIKNIDSENTHCSRSSSRHASIHNGGEARAIDYLKMADNTGQVCRTYNYIVTVDIHVENVLFFNWCIYFVHKPAKHKTLNALNTGILCTTLTGCAMENSTRRKCVTFHRGTISVFTLNKETVNNLSGKTQNTQCMCFWFQERQWNTLPVLWRPRVHHSAVVFF